MNEIYVELKGLKMSSKLGVKQSNDVRHQVCICRMHCDGECFDYDGNFQSCQLMFLGLKVLFLDILIQSGCFHYVLSYFNTS